MSNFTSAALGSPNEYRGFYHWLETRDAQSGKQTAFAVRPIQW